MNIGSGSSVSNLKAMFEKNISKQSEQQSIPKRNTVIAPKHKTLEPVISKQNPEVLQSADQKKEDKKEIETKSSVSDLKSVFEKQSTTGSTPKGVIGGGTPKNPGDSGWIKKDKPEEQKVVVQQQPDKPSPFKKEEPPAKQNPFP